MTAYPACIYHDDEGYTIIFPDLNALATDGRTFSEAMDHAVDCLAGYVYIAQQRRETLPEPSDPSSVDPQKVTEELFPGEPSCECFVSMISVDVPSYARSHFEKSVKKTLTIPAWLNKPAEEKHLNFSQVLQEALKEKLL